MNVQKFNRFQVERQNGEWARLRVLQGPDQGAVFVAFAETFSLGRNDENDIILADTKVSRRHIEVFKTRNGWQIKDLGSANGIVVNGAETRASPLNSGDNVKVGDTTLEFLVSEEVSALLQASMMQIEQRKKMGGLQEDVQKKRVQEMVTPLSLDHLKAAFGFKSGEKKNFLNPRVIALGLTGIAALWWVTQDGKAPEKTLRSGKEVQEPLLRDPASYKVGLDTKELRQTSDIFFHMGFRDYREGNYLRAKTHFQTVLQVNPNHTLAKLYLQNCKNSIQEEAKFHLEQGRKSLTARKNKSARNHFESITRLMEDDPENPLYKEAKENVEKLRESKKGRS